MKYTLGLRYPLEVPEKKGKNFTYELALQVAFLINYNPLDARFFERKSGSKNTVIAKYSEQDKDYFLLVFKEEKEGTSVTVKYCTNEWNTFKHKLKEEDIKPLLAIIELEQSSEEPQRIHLSELVETIETLQSDNDSDDCSGSQPSRPYVLSLNLQSQASKNISNADLKSPSLMKPIR